MAREIEGGQRCKQISSGIMMDHNHSQPFTFRARKSQNFMNERIIKNKHCNKISIKVSHYAFAWLKICCIWILGICMDDNSLLWPLYICDFNCFIFSWWAGMISEPILPAVEAVTHRLLFGDAAVRGWLLHWHLHCGVLAGMPRNQ